MSGPAVGGEASVRYALHLLRREINVDLALAGGARVENAGRERVVRSAECEWRDVRRPCRAISTTAGTTRVVRPRKTS